MKPTLPRMPDPHHIIRARPPCHRARQLSHSPAIRRLSGGYAAGRTRCGRPASAPAFSHVTVHGPGRVSLQRVARCTGRGGDRRAVWEGERAAGTAGTGERPTRILQSTARRSSTAGTGDRAHHECICRGYRRNNEVNTPRLMRS